MSWCGTKKKKKKRVPCPNEMSQGLRTVASSPVRPGRRRPNMSELVKTWGLTPATPRKALGRCLSPFFTSSQLSPRYRPLAIFALSQQGFLNRLGARRHDADGPADVRLVLLLVVDAQSLTNGRQQLRHRHWPFFNGRPILAGVPNHLPALDAATSQYRAE